MTGGDLPPTQRVSRLARLIGAACVLALLCAGARVWAFDFHDFQQLVTSNRFHSIDTLLAALPASYREHYVVLFDSRSLQSASFERPRVILYGDDARLLIGFNGDPAGQGYDVLETAEYDPAAQDFNFRELRVVEGKEGEGRSLQLSSNNPPLCQGCHGSPPRPIWDSSPLWPGAFGERYLANLSPAERHGIEVFLSRQVDNPRYRILVNAQRLAYGNTYRPDARTRYEGEARESPNAELDELLGQLNRQRLVAELKGYPEFDRYRYALLGMAEHCGLPASFWPAATRTRIQQDWEASQTLHTALTDQQRQLKQARSASMPNRAEERGLAGDENAVMDAVRFVAQEGLGMRPEGWSMALEENATDFQTPQQDELALARLLQPLAMSADAGSLIDTPKSSPQYSESDCDWLRQRSQTVLSGMSVTRVSSREGGANAVTLDALGECGACHMSGAAPVLPFESLSGGSGAGQSERSCSLFHEMGYRVTPQAGDRHMPLNRLLTIQERQTLLEELASPSPRGTVAGRAANPASGADKPTLGLCR